MSEPILTKVPPSGVVSVPVDSFGKDKSGIQKAPDDVAKLILSKDPDEIQPNPGLLPDYKNLTGKISKDIRVERTPILRSPIQIKTGAGDRRSDGPIDPELRKSRIFGDRLPVREDPVRTDGNTTRGIRQTGAVDRPPAKRDVGDDPVRVPPGREMPKTDTPTEPRREPVRQPRYDPPPKPSDEPVRQPRNDPPPREEPVRQPRYDPPPQPREEPVRQPPARVDPPQKSEPKDEPRKPSESGERKSKDG